MLARSTLLASTTLLVLSFGCGSETPPAPSTTCDANGIAHGCTAGRCRIVGPAGAIPAGAIATLREDPEPTTLQGDTLNGSVCTVSLPTGSTAVTLEIDGGKPLGTAAVAFSVDSQWGTAKLLPDGHRDGTNTFAANIASSGSFGLSERPGPSNVERYIGTDSSIAVDAPSLLRNLSAQFFTSGFWDGTRLFVANGSRLLVYKGIPAPGAMPTFVLGQPDLNTTIAATSLALFGNVGVNGIWSDGARLVVSQGNRVLIWLQMPEQSLTPADLVLGQTDGAGNGANAGGISASTMAGPTAIDSDGNQLVVADSSNNRILVWKSFPTANGQPADFVVGQPDFGSSAINGGQLKLYTPHGAALSTDGLYVAGIGGPGLAFTPTVTQSNPAPTLNVFSWLSPVVDEGVLGNAGAVHRNANGSIGVRDYAWGRALFVRGTPASLSKPDFILGQPDYPRVVSRNWTTGLYTNPARVLGSSFGQQVTISARGALVVPDDRRLLVWSSAPTYNFEPPTFIVGQSGPAVNERNDYRTVSGATLAEPADVAVGGGIAAVADRGNNRVLLFKTADLTQSTPTAFAILGQTDGAGFFANGGTNAASAATLSGPEGVCMAAGRIAVADTENHRVLVWNTVPTKSGVPADTVLGQDDFAGRRPNHGNGDVSPVDGYSDVDAKGVFYPTGLACNDQHLFVADRLNHRVLAWDSWPTTNGAPATRVLGQPSMTQVGAARGAGAFSVVPDGLNLPTGLTLAGNVLWVADTEDNRVVGYSNPFDVAPTPFAFLGQPDGVTVSNPHYQGSTGAPAGAPVSLPPTTSSSVLRPRGVALVGNRIFVSETDSNRVHLFDATTLASVGFLGQSVATGASPNSFGSGAKSVAEPMGIASDGSLAFVVDARNHRVLGFDVNVASGGAATTVLGQPTMLSGGFNASSVAKGGTLAQPRGVALSGEALFVADTGNNRVLELDAKSVVSLKRVYGQPNDVLALPNSGGAASASTLSAPQGVWADEARLVVADTGNHRVLVYDRKGATSAVLVLGQTDFQGTSSNAGGVGASTLSQPKGVCSDGKRLFVADAANNRVLGWSVFPSKSGTPADLVLGQAQPNANLPNRGLSGPNELTLSSPAGCVVLDQWLFVADTSNNRVLRFSIDASSDAAAKAVFGQGDFVSRGPASSAGDLNRLAGPVALATDGANLFVVDRDLSRVARFVRGTIETSGPATEILGGVGSGSLLRVGGGIAVTRTPLLTTRLYGADTAADRVAVVASVSRLLE